MLSAFEGSLRAIDARIASAEPEEIPGLLGTLPADVFGCLLLDVPEWLTNLHAYLPSMPADEIQINWTGAAGRPLLQQSLAYYRSLHAHVAALTGLNWADATVADYGCGWGRLTRLFHRDTPCNNIYGLDPWDRSIALCRQHGVRAQLFECAYVPSDLPVGDTRFHVINCFSVFTHLSEKCHRQVLKVMRKYLLDDGVLAITIRPPEYWDIHNGYPDGVTVESMKARSREQGYAFIPHQRAPIDGDITYGDTSISLEYIRAEWTDWKLAAVDWNLIDPFQVILYLVPR